MELIIELSEKLEEGFYIGKEKGGKKGLFLGKTKKECIVRSREHARSLKSEKLKLIDNQGNEIYKVKFFWRENLKYECCLQKMWN